MTSSARSAEVRIDGTPVGTIRESDERYSFTYLPEWVARENAMPVSLPGRIKADCQGKYIHIRAIA